MESKKINQLATELTPQLSDLTIIGDPTTGISKKITLSQMASLFTGTVEEYANLAAFPLVGVADTIYIALDTNVLYRWNGSTYVELSPNIVSSLVFNDANGFDGTIALVGSEATLTITTALTLGSLPFIGASGALTQDNANLFYDDANNRLGIGTNAPTTPLDVFGSGIISRVNGTSTNNGFLGFANDGTNKWSVGNVQSDHRFRIFSEANTAELVSVLQTGEFGIGIANPTTKLHLDGGATALIANLDANVSVAKSISFRSDNSARINLEVSGTESGTNAGGNFFIRRFSDAGVLIDTPLTITRSTGLITLGGNLTGLSSTFSSIVFASAFIPTNSSIPTNGMYLSAANTLDFSTNSTNRLSITSGGNVGIGTTAPDGKLDVNGLSYFRDDLILYAAKKLYLDSGGDTYLSEVSANNIQIVTAGTERMRLDASGNLGLGVTPSAWSTVSPAIELTAGSFIASQGSVNTMYIGSNHYYNGSNFIYKQNGFATQYQVGAGLGNHHWYTSASGTAGNAISFTQAMTLFSNGNLAVGTTTDAGFKLDVNGTGRFTSSTSPLTSINNTGRELGIFQTVTNGGYLTFQSSGANVRGYIGNGSGISGASETSFGIRSESDLILMSGGNNVRLTIASTGAATFTNTLRVNTPNRSFFMTSNAYSISDGYLSSGFGMDGDGLYLGNVVSSSGWTIANPQVTITSGGNVGIGTTTYSDFKLDVNGTGRFSGSDNTMLTINSSFSGGYTALQINESGTIKGLIGYGTYLTTDGGVAIRTAASTPFTIAIGSAVPNFTLASTGAATFSSSVTTGAPSGGTAKPFKIGNVATVTPTSQNRTIEIEIDGTTYYITAKTTNN